MNARAVALWTAACLVIVLATSNPAYKLLVLAATLSAVVAGAGWSKTRRWLIGVGLIAGFAVLLNFVSAHVGTTVLFSLPGAIPVLGGPYTLEALAFGATGGVTIAAALLAAAPFSLMLKTHDVMDALPAPLARTGTAIAASLNLVPAIGASFLEVTEAQRLRGWRPRGPRSWAEVVVPVVLTSVEGSIQLAESMEARAFGSGARVTMRSPVFNRADWLVVAASVVAVVGFLVAMSAGWVGDWGAYPTLSVPAIDPRPVIACLFLLAPVVTWRSRA